MEAKDGRVMKKLWNWMAWKKLGKPEPGRVRQHPPNSYTFDEGAEIQKRLEKAFGDLSRLNCMDLGCGPGDSAISQNILQIPWRSLISVEALLPYVNRLRQKTALAQRHDVREIRVEQIFEEFVSGEADVILMMDVLEHFPYRDALRLLTRLEPFARRGIVIFSPLGHTAQEPIDGNALQLHRSFWDAQDLTRLGYDVDVYQGFHLQFDPPAPAFWAIKTWQRD